MEERKDDRKIVCIVIDCSYRLDILVAVVYNLSLKQFVMVIYSPVNDILNVMALFNRSYSAGANSFSLWS